MPDALAVEEVEEAEPPTLAAGPRALRDEPGEAPATTIASSADALQVDELVRSRRLGLTGLSLAIAAAVALPLLGGDPYARAVLIVSLSALAAANLFLLWVAREQRRWTRGRVTLVWVVGIAATLGITYFFGLLSGALIGPMMALYFIGLGQSRAIALLSFGLFGGGHALLLGLTLGGVLVERGLVRAGDLPVAVQLGSEALILGVLLSGYLLARASRRTTAETIVELERAVRAIAQREALLQEARQDFERALRLGGVGRYTDEVVGSFRLGVVIGRGAVGEVYEALAIGSGAPAAVKLLHLDAVTRPGQVERFRREAQIASTLRSPHVVRVLEVGQGPVGLPYLAMERLTGTDLSGTLRERGRLGLAEVVALVAQLAAGLDEAARAGIVHRDLKPQNVFRVEGAPPTWKILDFGVSKLAGHGGTLTQGHVVGTPQYMAPEQAAGAEIDHRADVYGLAALAYRCLTGRPPFFGPDIPSLLYQVVHTMPTRPGALVELPAEVDAVLLRGLAKRPADRHPSAGALAAALAGAATPG
jgi:eukaryotic-like serine/threonine-protein kinase